MFRTVLLGFLLLSITIALSAENISGISIKLLNSENQDIRYRPEEIVIVDLEAIPDYQDGIELNFDISPGLKQYQKSFALLIYKGISPKPSEKNLSYSGNRVLMRLLPSKDSLYIRIPFRKDHNISVDAYSHLLPQVIRPDELPLMITVLPILKGIPKSAFDNYITVSTTPLWRNEGILNVNISNNSGIPEEIITISVDGNEIDADENITVEPGIHNIRISSTHAPMVEKKVIIAAGETLVLPIELNYRPPRMTLNFPAEAQILFDGALLEINENSGTVEIEAGEHEITAILGDYKISRRFSISPAGQVNIELQVDLSVIGLGSTSESNFDSE